jgi:hypothetical protein
MKGEREVAGLRCGEVLATLSDVVDGTIAPELARKVQLHVAGCDVCERFGGAFAEVVRALREEGAEPLPAGVAERLARRLAREP